MIAALDSMELGCRLPRGGPLLHRRVGLACHTDGYRRAERLALVAKWKQAQIQEKLNKALGGISLDGSNEAFDRGASIVTLEASHFGEHTYARMGYRVLYRYAVLIKL